MRHFLSLLIGSLFFAGINCTQEAQPETAENTVTLGDFTLSDLWVRSAKSGMMSAAYFTIQNTGSVADSILSVESEISEDAQIHLSAMNDEGMMGMEPQGLVPVPAGDPVIFEQGGLHIMIIRPYQDLTPGDSVSLSLYMSSGKTLTVKAPVKQ